MNGKNLRGVLRFLRYNNYTGQPADELISVSLRLFCVIILLSVFVVQEIMKKIATCYCNESKKKKQR